MKRVSKFLMIVYVIAAMLLISACSEESKSASGTGQATKKIGIVQIVEHPSLNTIRESIIKQLEKKGFKDGDNIIIDYQNAQGDQANLKTISQKFVGQKYDLIVAIATPSAQVVAGETSEIPIVFSACTDPISSGLVTDLDMPGKNITGTSDVISAEKNLELIQQITPQVKTLGVLYNSSESGSVLVVDELKSIAKEKGISLTEATVTSTAEVQQAIQSLVEKADAVFSPNDNTIATCMSVVSQVTSKAQKPLFVGADSMVKDGGIAGCGINYVQLGSETGDMVADILNGKKPGDIPVRVMKQMNIYVNKDSANKIGITIPDEVLKKATTVFGK